MSDVLLTVNNIECANRTTEEIQSILNNLPVGPLCLVVSANPQNKLPIDPGEVLVLIISLSRTYLCMAKRATSSLP